MSRDPNHEASDIDPSLGRPVKRGSDATRSPSQVAADEEKNWVQENGKRKGLQVNLRTKKWRFIP